MRTLYRHLEVGVTCPSASVEHTSLACSTTSPYHGPSQLAFRRPMPTRGLDSDSCSCESCPSFTPVGFRMARHVKHGTGSSTEGLFAHISKVLVNILCSSPKQAQWLTPALRRWAQKDQEFGAILGIVSSVVFWATWVSKTKRLSKYGCHSSRQW